MLLQVEKQRRWLYGFSDATKNELPFQGQKSYDINSKCGMWSCFMRVFNAIKLFCSSSERRVVVKNVAARDLTLQHSLVTKFRRECEITSSERFNIVPNHMDLGFC